MAGMDHVVHGLPVLWSLGDTGGMTHGSPGRCVRRRGPTALGPWPGLAAQPEGWVTAQEGLDEGLSQNVTASPLQPASPAPASAQGPTSGAMRAHGFTHALALGLNVQVTLHRETVPPRWRGEGRGQSRNAGPTWPLFSLAESEVPHFGRACHGDIPAPPPRPLLDRDVSHLPRQRAPGVPEDGQAQLRHSAGRLGPHRRRCVAHAAPGACGPRRSEPCIWRRAAPAPRPSAGIRQRYNHIIEELLPDELQQAGVTLQTDRGLLVRAVMMWTVGRLSTEELVDLGLADLVRCGRPRASRRGAFSAMRRRLASDPRDPLAVPAGSCACPSWPWTTTT